MDIVNGKEIYCEIVSERSFGKLIGPAKICWMNGTTSIDTPAVSVSTRDESINVLYFSWNQKIHHLPIKTSATYPNLLALYAGYCSITNISRQNFRGLSSLKSLILQGNQIEKIASGVFKDLTNLERLYLGEKSFILFQVLIFFFLDVSDYNKIKYMNGKLFMPLRKLTTIQLNGNICFGGMYVDTPTKIAALPQLVDEKCQFDEDETIATEESSAASKRIENELDALKAQLSQWNATCIAQTKELRDALQFKVQENIDLRNKMMKQETEIIDKNEEIKNLKKKIETLTQF